MLRRLTENILEKRKQRYSARQKSFSFYQLLMKSQRFIPFKRYSIIAKLMASPHLKSTIFPVEGRKWIISPYASSTWAPFGLKEPHIFFHLKTLLQNADGFIDCGANLGWYSLLASRYNRIKSIIAIEPVSQSVRYLKIIKQLNQIENLTIVKGCISDHDGIVLFSLPEQRFSEMGCVETLTMNGDNSRFLLESPSYTLQSIVDKIPTSLNHICMKVDIEGHERTVLNSVTRETLAKRFQSAVVEVHLYKFSKPEEELEEICQILSVIGEPQFLLSPQFSPSYARFLYHRFKYYPISKLKLGSILDLIRRSKISELHVLVERKPLC